MQKLTIALAAVVALATTPALAEAQQAARKLWPGGCIEQQSRSRGDGTEVSEDIVDALSP